MKKLMIILLIAISIIGCSPRQEPLPRPTPIYDTDHIEMEQEELQTIIANHRLTMVNAWATFCPACDGELPVLGRLVTEFDDESVQIVGIVLDAVDEQGQPLEAQITLAKEMMVRAGVSHRHFLPTVEMLDTFLSDIQAIPTTFFFDQDGEQVGEAIIGGRSQIEWMEEINQRLSEMD